MINLNGENNNYNNITWLYNSILELTLALKSSSGNDFNRIEEQFGPLIKLFDTINLRLALRIIWNKKRKKIYIAPAIYDIGFFNIFKIKKLIAQARLFDLATAKAVRPFESFYSDRFLGPDTNSQIFYFNFLIRILLTAAIYTIFLLLNAPFSPFTLINVPAHISFHVSDIFFFFIYPLYIDMPSIELAYLLGAKYMVINNAITLFIDLFFLAIHFYLFFCLYVLFYPTYLRSPIYSRLVKLRRSSKPVYNSLATLSVPIAMIFFITRFIFYWVNYFAVLESLFGEGKDPLIFGRPKFKTFKTLCWRFIR